MLPADDVSAATASTVKTGQVGWLDGVINTVEDSIEKSVIAAGAAGTGGDLQVELQRLVDFYAQLADLHDALAKQIAGVSTNAAQMTQSGAAGSVPGVRTAMSAIVDAVGGSAAGSTSLVSNMRAVDGLILSHMQALKANAEQYAAQENVAIAGLGKAARVASATSPAPASARTPQTVTF